MVHVAVGVQNKPTGQQTRLLYEGVQNGFIVLGVPRAGQADGIYVSVTFIRKR